MRKLIFLMIGIVCLVSITRAVEYKSYIDEKGFNKIYNYSSGSMIYQNYTLNINKGDNVIWMNDDDNDHRITLVSNLWSNDSMVLGWQTKEFNYTFDEEGIYDIFIKENPKLGHLRVVVGMIDKANNQTKRNQIEKNNNQDFTNKINNTENTSNFRGEEIANKNSRKEDLFSKLRQWDTIILISILISMYILSGRIKEI